MLIVTAILMTVCLLGVLFCILMSLRNNAVAAERYRVIDKMYDLAGDDIRAGREWEWRREDYERISYNEMMLKFWRPVDSFYRGAKCLEA